MPFIHIRLAGLALSPARREALNREAARLVAVLLRKQPALTAALLEPVGPDALWTVGGAAPAAAAHLEVLVTAGTNTTAEKAAFIDAAAALLREVCGPETPVATYVVIREAAGENWGYDGLTQAARRAAANDKPSAGAMI